MWHVVGRYFERLVTATGLSERELWIGVCVAAVVVGATFLRGFGSRRY